MVVGCGVCPFIRSLCGLEGGVYEELLNLIKKFPRKDFKDSSIWKPSISGKFSVKDFYLALEGNRPHRAPSYVWLGLVPPWWRLFVG